MEERESEPATSDSTLQAGPNLASLDLVGIAQEALQNAENSTVPADTRIPQPVPREPGEKSQNDSRPHVKSDQDNATSKNTSAGALTNGVPPNTNRVGSSQSSGNSSKPEATSPKLTGDCAAPLVNGYPHKDSSATSPNSRELTIPLSKGSPRQTLPALQNPSSPLWDGPNGSPNQGPKLPSFRQLSELAEAASNEQNEARANGYHPHRQSFSSTGQSPTLVSRHFSSAQRSPPSAFPPLSATSPISAHSDISQDPFRQGTFTFFNNRRPSQASENGPYPSGLPSASTGDSYPSSDSFSPASQVTPIEGHRMSIDGAVNRTLPPPTPTGPHIQHIPPHGVGGFKCEHPGCSATPFQTQYLLK